MPKDQHRQGRNKDVLRRLSKAQVGQHKEPGRPDAETPLIVVWQVVNDNGNPIQTFPFAQKDDAEHLVKALADRPGGPFTLRQAKVSPEAVVELPPADKLPSWALPREMWERATYRSLPASHGPIVGSSSGETENLEFSVLNGNEEPVVLKVEMSLDQMIFLASKIMNYVAKKTKEPERP